MVRIAVAGGTGGLGRTLVDELAQGGEHVVFVLSRKVFLDLLPRESLLHAFSLKDGIDDCFQVGTPVPAFIKRALPGSTI